MSKDVRVKKEVARLRKVFANMPEDVLKVSEGLFIQAARMRVSLDDLWADICENGDVEQFTQSADAPAYERLRPVAQLFNSRDKAYQTIVKQLTDRLPDKKEREDAREALRKFNEG